MALELYEALDVLGNTLKDASKKVKSGGKMTNKEALELGISFATALGAEIIDDEETIDEG